MTTARNLMTQSPAVIDVTSAVGSAIERFAKLDIRHLPVVDSDGALVGMLSDRDVARASDANIETSVASVMSDPVLVLTPEIEMSAIAQAMIDYKVGALPVVNGENALIGIVSYIDLLRTMT